MVQTYLALTRLDLEDWDIHSFNSLNSLFRFLKLDNKYRQRIKNHFNTYGVSFYPKVFFNYAICMIEDCSVEEFFTRFNASIEPLLRKFLGSAKCFLQDQENSFGLESLLESLDPYTAVLSVFEWINDTIDTPKIFLHIRNFTDEELLWLQVYVGRELKEDSSPLAIYDYN